MVVAADVRRGTVSPRAHARGHGAGSAAGGAEVAPRTDGNIRGQRTAVVSLQTNPPEFGLGGVVEVAVVQREAGGGRTREGGDLDRAILAGIDAKHVMT